MSTSPVTEGLVDVLDDDGNVTGTATRAAVRAGNLRHRAVFIAVLNSSNELLVHRRAAWKDVWPGAWDIAFGGVVEAGEAWEVAAARELAEEVGLRTELVYLGEGGFDDDHVREVARVYLTRHDGDVALVDGEVVEVDWIPMRQMCAWIDDHDVCSDSVAIVLPRLDSP